MDDTVKNNEDVKYLFIVGENGEVIVSSEKALAVSDELLAANASVAEDGLYRESSKALETDAGRIMTNARPPLTCSYVVASSMYTTTLSMTMYST